MDRWSLRQSFQDDPQRFSRYSLELPGLLLDYSKNRIDDAVLAQLLVLATQVDLAGQIRRMFAAEPINVTEGRPAFHVALRGSGQLPLRINGQDILPEVRQIRWRMRELVTAVHERRWLGYGDTPITDVVNIGIGGSDLGPRMVVEALADPRASVRTHFLANVDGQAVERVLANLNPRATLFIINSKSFSTLETFTNAATCREWLRAEGIPEEALTSRHFVAVSANIKAVAAFGIPEANRFPIWDWVGGRYSLWSATGLVIPLALGMDCFEQLLAGAAMMDEHFLNAPLAANMPVLLGLIGLWYVDFWGAQSHAVLPYDERLEKLPAWLQQLDMESNGKRVRLDGQFVDYDTGPIIWGSAGTNGQHAFFQLLHQGTRLVPIDFIGCVRPGHKRLDHHHKLLGNFLAQSKALMLGRNESETRQHLQTQGLAGAALEAMLPHQIFPGNQPSNSLLVEELTPRTLGMLLALYEHKVFVQGAIWGINSFDQWGVELGKRMALGLIDELNDKPAIATHDASTQGLLDYCHRWSRPN
jgi:glucose-6-phosphate isomerase